MAEETVKVLFFELKHTKGEEGRSLQRFIPLNRLPLQQDQKGRQVAYEMQRTPDWGIDCHVIEVTPQELRQLEREEARVELSGQDWRVVRNRGGRRG